MAPPGVHEGIHLVWDGLNQRKLQPKRPPHVHFSTEDEEDARRTYISLSDASSQTGFEVQKSNEGEQQQTEFLHVPKECASVGINCSRRNG